MEQLRVGDESYGFHKLDASATRLPYTLRILLENVLRQGSEEGADAVSGWVAKAEPSHEIAFAPRACAAGFHGRALRGRPRRDARRDARQGGDPKAINPLIPVELVIDHSVQVDEFARDSRSAQRRARVRAEPRALRVPPLGPGRVRQLPRRAARTPASSTRSTSSTSRASSKCARRRLPRHARRHRLAHDDGQRPRRARLGVGGIEAEAAMLGEALSMLVPQVWASG